MTDFLSRSCSNLLPRSFLDRTTPVRYLGSNQLFCSAQFVTTSLPFNPSSPHRYNTTAIKFTMPYLNDLLSQYECLLAICNHLSSAVIVHVATTCKENQASITASEKTHKRLKKNACCDGKGIVAQARIFGHHGGRHLTKPEWECLGAYVKPCSDCSAQVCNVRTIIP